MSLFDPTEMVRVALLDDPLVRSVVLVGSRASGTATALSDWDYQVGSPDPAAVALRLPDLTGMLRPLARLWDPLARHPVYMLMVADGERVAKIDLLLDLPERIPDVQPSTVTADTLPGIDAHFWDWNLWLGSKRLRGDETLVRAQLAGMWDHVLKPMGGSAPPASQREAIVDYLRLRRLWEERLHLSLEPDLGRAVRATLAAHRLL